MATPPRYELPPESFEGRSQSEWLRKLALAVRGLMLGKANNVYEVTLRTSPNTTTTLTAAQVTLTSTALLSARTSTAASATGLWTEVTTAGELIIHHNSSASANRTFRVVILG